MSEISEPDGTGAGTRALGASGASAGATGTRAASIAARIDRLPITRTHKRATIAIGLGMFFDIYEVFLAGVLSGVLTQQFHLSKVALAPVLASTFIGMFLGAVVMGRVADKIGRRRAFLFNLALYSTFSLIGAFSPNAVFLMVSRFIAGLGLGAELPLADTYLTDLLPAPKRGRYIAWAYTVSFIGVPVVGFLAHSLATQPVFGIAGWRWIFVIGAAGGFVVYLLRRGLPESPRWLESVGRTAKADEITAQFEREARESLARHGEQLPEPANSSPVAAARPSGRAALRMLMRRPLGTRTAMMVVFHLFQTIGYYGFGTMVPLVLAAKGYPVSESLLFTALTYVGYPVGAAVSLPLVDRFERKFLVVGSVILMALFGLAFGFSDGMVPILIFGFLYTAVSNVFSNAYHIYQAEIFPTAVRSTAASSTYAVSRLATAAMPFVLLPVLADAGVGALFGVVCAALAIVALDITLFGPRTTGRSVESVSG
jgi:putative MFS transporter